MKALLIEVDWETGVRAGGFKAKNNNEWMVPWTRDTVGPNGVGVEVRVPLDDALVDSWRDIDGIQVLETDQAIDQAIQQHIIGAVDQQERFEIYDSALYRASLASVILDDLVLQQKTHRANDTPEFTEYELMRELYARGALGVRKLPPQQILTAAEVRARREFMLRNATSVQKRGARVIEKRGVFE